MPQDAEVGHVWDGGMRTIINCVWLTRNGTVATADYGMVVYDDEDRPTSAPTKKLDRYWKTPTEEEAMKDGKR